MDLVVQYTVKACNHCGFQFALPNSFVARRREDHKSFHCPSCGHSMYWPQLSDKERLKRQLKNVQACCVEYQEKAISLERSRRSYKGHLNRRKKST